LQGMGAGQIDDQVIPIRGLLNIQGVHSVGGFTHAGVFPFRTA
jgi:hypothetical protein